MLLQSDSLNNFGGKKLWVVGCCCCGLALSLCVLVGLCLVHVSG